MKDPEINENMVEFHHAFTEALDDFIVQSVTIAEDEFDLESTDAFSMMASRMMFIVIRGAVKGGASKESVLETLGTAYEIVKLALSEPEGGLQ